MDNICVNTRSSIKITGSKTIYFDPLEIAGEPHDADVVLITHEHYDHFSPEDIKKVIKKETLLIVPEVMLPMIKKSDFRVQAVYGIAPFETKNFDEIECKGIPAYNIGKQFHPKDNCWLGYLIWLDGKTYYAMGDTDVTPEAKAVGADVVFVPIGGKYTMDAAEAAELMNENRPGLVVPIHYGSSEVCEEFCKLLNDEIKVQRFW